MDEETTGGAGEAGRGFVSWARHLYRELAMLPDTLDSFRKGVMAFQETAERLNRSSEALSRAGHHAEAVGLTGALRGLDTAARALEHQAAATLNHIPGMKQVQGAAGDLAHALDRVISGGGDKTTDRD